jgi:peptide/nickel transport system ATP-binding protein
MQIIPQHPEDAFNPRWKLRRSVLEPYEIHTDIPMRGSRQEKLQYLLDRTGLNPDYANRYPHQLSGGELQRAAIARTIALEPDFIVCDEPTSMLDVSVQASIIRLLKDIQRESGVSYLFITHDIRIARLIGDTIGVLYNGLIVEEGPGILHTPLHPYTRSLMMKSPKNAGPPYPDGKGCPWQSVCPVTDEACIREPVLEKYDPIKIRCHYPELLQRYYKK